MIEKKRLNLLRKEPRNRIRELVIGKTVFYATIVGIILFAVFLLLNLLNIIQKRDIETKLKEKESVLNYIVSNNNDIVKSAYFSLKNDLLKKYMKDDAEFLPYYTVLNDSIASASNSARVESLYIDKSKKTEFVIDFNDYNAIYKYIKYTESDMFLKNFVSLTLTSFSIDQTNISKNKGYILNFEGQFKELQK